MVGGMESPINYCEFYLSVAMDIRYPAFDPQGIQNESEVVVSILFIGQGVGQWQAYVIIWTCLTMGFWARRGGWSAVLKATGITVLLYFSPCLTFLAFCVWFYMGYESMNRPRQQGVVSFNYEYWGDAQDKALHNGYFLTSGASYMSATEVPPELERVARRAVLGSPYMPNGNVAIRTTVEMVGGKPAIFDHVVTARQIESYHSRGIWDDPEPARHPQTGELLPAPTGLAAQFMSQFNGPTTKKVRRQG